MESFTVAVVAVNQGSGYVIKNRLYKNVTE